MQQPEIKPDIRGEISLPSILPSPTHAIYKGRRIRDKGFGTPKKIFTVFHDCSEPSGSLLVGHGSNQCIDHIFLHGSDSADERTVETMSRTAKAEPCCHSPQSVKQQLPKSRNTALLLPVNAVPNARNLPSRTRFSPMDAQTSADCPSKSRQTEQDSTSPRKLLWPIERPYTSRNLQQRQFSPEAFRKNIQPVRNFSRHPYRHPPTISSELSPCRPRGSFPRRLEACRNRLHSPIRIGRQTTIFGSDTENPVQTSNFPELPPLNRPESTERLGNHERTAIPALSLPNDTPQLFQATYQPSETPEIFNVANQNIVLPAPSQPEAHAPLSAFSRRAGNSNPRSLIARKLPEWQVWMCRIAFGTIILSINIALLITYFLTDHHQYLLAILVFMKSKDLLSTLADILGLTYQSFHDKLCPPEEVSSKWILSLISAYAETDEQIMKTINSLVSQALTPHRQVICIIVDGKNPSLLTHFTNVTHMFERVYTTWKGGSSEMIIHAGFIQSTPIIYMRKMRNAGKKDSLIIGHDLFNYPRKNMPQHTKDLRQLMYTDVLPKLTAGVTFSTFDAVFCTDADSIIHKDALRKLADALARKSSAIAACGILVAELAIPAVEWTIWHLYQQFQYTFGQYVRRQAEGIWGRVTCLPGCITMISVRPEVGPAIALYARPVTSTNLLEHQVQYLGTDRRLTWCLLSQSTRLTSVLVPGALCETVVPESLEHYLSQRRRWASNAYFNDYYYAFGKQQRLITRLFALIDIVRQSLVFYRVINTALFIRSLILNFYIIKLTPTLVLTKTPALWFLLLALIREPILRKRFHKLIVGMCINQFISPILSVIVFANVLLNMGSQVWGTTGLSSADSRPTSMLYPLQVPVQPPVTPIADPSWSPQKLASIVRTAVRGLCYRPNTISSTAILETAETKSARQLKERDKTPTKPGSKAAYVAETLGSALRRRTPKVAKVFGEK